MAKPLPALRVLKAAQVVCGMPCSLQFRFFTGQKVILKCNLQAVSSPVAEYVKNNPAPHLVRCFIEPRFYPYPMLLYQECRSQGSSQTPGLNLDGGELICDYQLHHGPVLG